MLPPASSLLLPSAGAIQTLRSYLGERESKHGRGDSLDMRATLIEFTWPVNNPFHVMPPAPHRLRGEASAERKKPLKRSALRGDQGTQWQLLLCNRAFGDALQSYSTSLALITVPIANNRAFVDQLYQKG